MWLLGTLIILWLLAAIGVHEPEMLRELKRRYAVIRSDLPRDPRWHLLKDKVSIVTGVGSRSGTVGLNVNKGYEIYICLSNDMEDIESAMYVFLHELAHMTVSEYDHSTEFWKNFKDLRHLAETMGVFKPSTNKKEYCGDKVF